MKRWLATLPLFVALASCGGNHHSGNNSAALKAHPLAGDQVQAILTGNTLVGYDEAGPFWMYYPSLGTMWGRASNGDVDVGQWRVQHDMYCRSWRKWRAGQEQCWKFATDGSNRLIWLDPHGHRTGVSTVQAGNTIGQITQSQTAQALFNSDIQPVVAPPQPVDAFGRPLLAAIDPAASVGEPSGIDAGSNRAQHGDHSSAQAGGTRGGTGTGSGTGTGGTGGTGTGGTGGTGTGGTGTGGTGGTGTGGTGTGGTDGGGTGGTGTGGTGGTDGGGTGGTGTGGTGGTDGGGTGGTGTGGTGGTDGGGTGGTGGTGTGGTDGGGTGGTGGTGSGTGGTDGGGAGGTSGSGTGSAGG
jgi:hypothetical protein